jgi:murein DD-endopeptidase MepM/ murein hydrolase activator NlpD
MRIGVESATLSSKNVLQSKGCSPLTIQTKISSSLTMVHFPRGYRWLGWLFIFIVSIVMTLEFREYVTPAMAEEISQQADQVSTNPWAGYSFPVENFTAYTSPFGYRQHPYGGYRFHYGLDLAAPMGSYVRNWWDGVVIRVAEDSACGTHAIIQSGQWTHVYCHMQGHVVVEREGGRVLVDRGGGIGLRQGSTIRAGTRIGRVGMTGSTTGPHLHWGLKYNGAWVDPAIVIRAMADT